jgi:hypothetical protein
MKIHTRIINNWYRKDQDLFVPVAVDIEFAERTGVIDSNIVKSI